MNEIIEAPAALPTEAQKATTAAAESRAQAVNALTQTALLRAGTLELGKDESASLQADFGDEDFRPGAGGKEELIYIEHAALRDRLNTVLGLGQWALIVRDTWNDNFQMWSKNKNKYVEGVKVYCRAMLIVRGCYVAEAVGDMDYQPSNAAQNYGDAFEGAKTAAFRRCAKEFGVGLQAWRKGWCEGWWARRKGGKPVPRKTDELSTETREYTPDIVPIGKHAAKGWNEVDTGYLKWAAEKGENVPANLRDGAKKELERRAAAEPPQSPREFGPDRDNRETVADLENAERPF